MMIGDALVFPRACVFDLISTYRFSGVHRMPAFRKYTSSSHFAQLCAHRILRSRSRFSIFLALAVLLL
ncbi:hypothetical protein CY34DRAFT_798205 [Suillus luteus UH-Slu-Lm8-n1]|uniref:Unplaced genomic scaffold CY34scaffold_7, whole genome shotgun sequence n=1 Tax=Suillus luteus UH-Slu-Lm8-n1 TaxID=930992 RepID=A0A0D0ADT4_9AGAM|nr:hypothetical protein CY34DRAFT_798205 [Suillus luteus UH-Slu-Lm8-n1]